MGHHRILSLRRSTARQFEIHHKLLTIMQLTNCANSLKATKGVATGTPALFRAALRANL